MSNFLRNGTVLPNSLLGVSADDFMRGFNRTYNNTAFRVGKIVASYDINDPKNTTKLTVEYDVRVIQQDGNKAIAAITYKNCLSTDGLGSKADFFDKAFRVASSPDAPGGSPDDFKGQNGAIVFVLCLDAITEKAIIVGGLNHPDRPSTLKDSKPYLEAEYNGVNIKVDNDGSTTLTFNGATDNDGKVVDSTQGVTTISIEKDGSFQVSNGAITQRFDKKGIANLTADDNIEYVTKKDFSVTATGNVNLTATKDLQAKMDKLVVNASGTASIACQELNVAAKSSITLKGSELKVEAQSMASIKAPSITLDGQVALGGPGGQPVLLLSAMFIGIGNLGLPVVSNVVSGFAIKTTAQ